MVAAVLDFLETIGLFGLFVAMFLEGSSIPFPGVFVVLAYGGLLEMTIVDTAFLSAVLALIYSLASLIPYFLGDKMESWLKKRYRKGIWKATRLFKRYGLWSIAISRPFGIGNYISYIAGISRVGLVKYLILTYLGILPWCFAILRLGDYFNGNYEAFRSFYTEYSYVVYGGAVMVGAIFFAISYRKRLLGSK